MISYDYHATAEAMNLVCGSSTTHLLCVVSVPSASSRKQFCSVSMINEVKKPSMCYSTLDGKLQWIFCMWCLEQWQIYRTTLTKLSDVIIGLVISGINYICRLLVPDLETPHILT